MVDGQSGSREICPPGGPRARPPPPRAWGGLRDRGWIVTTVSMPARQEELHEELRRRSARVLFDDRRGLSPTRPGVTRTLPFLSRFTAGTVEGAEVKHEDSDLAKSDPNSTEVRSKRSSARSAWSQTLPAADRLVLVMGGGAVWDRETGLVWQQSPSTAAQDWLGAKPFATVGLWAVAEGGDFRPFRSWPAWWIGRRFIRASPMATRLPTCKRVTTGRRPATPIPSSLAPHGSCSSTMAMWVPRSRRAPDSSGVYAAAKGRIPSDSVVA